MHRREVQARVDEPPVRLAPGVVAFGRIGHVAAQQRSPIQRAGVGALDRLLDLARHLPLGAGDVERLVHGLVPGLLLGGDVHRRLGGLAAVARASVRIHDLPGAGRIVAGRSIGRTLVAFVVAVLALAVPVLVVSVLAVGLAVAVLVLTVLVAGGIGRITGVLVIAVGRGFAVGRSVGPGGTGRCVGVVPGVVGAGLGQTVVGLLDAHLLPGFGVGREREPGVANERMGDELRGQLPALGVALAPARVVLQGAGHDHPRHRGLDEVRIGVRHPARRIADLVPVRRQRLARSGSGRSGSLSTRLPKNGCLRSNSVTQSLTRSADSASTREDITRPPAPARAAARSSPRTSPRARRRRA